MSKRDADAPGAPGQGQVPAAGDVRLALRYLARKGAYAVLRLSPEGVDGDYAVHTPDAAAAEPLATVPAGIMAQARSRGWLERDGDGRLRLAAAGVKELRRAASEPRSGPVGGSVGSPVGSPVGSKERRRQRQGRRAGAGRAAAHGVHESPLAWLRRRKDKDGQPLITEAQFTAGERLAADYRRAQISQRVTADWSGVAANKRVRRGAPGAGIDMSDAAAAGRERVNRALAAVGTELGGILIDVCCHETGLEAAERAEGWPQRAAKVVLQLGLTALARHYGLIAPERAPFARLRHWGDEDYRPSVDAWR